MLSSVMGVLLVALRHEMGSVTLRSVVQELNLSSSQSAYITRNEMNDATHSFLEVSEEGLTATATEVLADDDSHQLDVDVRSHLVRRYDPSSLTEVTRDGEFC